ncbi:TetR/AcrR family transcriptional regulator [Streptomyces sp. SPB074]|uniref:TetR/AcrR family transcriptional regulator n=1 Tax=Streptomyces sp. (strain SPB074) TaxID=465543 RepID=UPI00017FEE62|nr:TetR/AcrR family transcriptional regulator [Streptomyces sp. SPB074]EDY46247.1 TetR family transcriptional regulator [Streptomyces sp. SPB074]
MSEESGEGARPAGARPAVRRPRLTPAREDEFLDAALAVVRETGYEALTMEGVAARAQCGKATLYRLYGSKQRLVAAAVSRTRPAHRVPLDTGSLRGDLLAAARRAAAEFEDSTTLVWAVAHASIEDRALHDALRLAFIDPEAADLDATVDRALARGELSHRPAAARHLDGLLFGAALVRSLDGETAPSGLEALVDDVILPALLHS